MTEELPTLIEACLFGIVVGFTFGFGWNLGEKKDPGKSPPARLTEKDAAFCRSLIQQQVASMFESHEEHTKQWTETAKIYYGGKIPRSRWQALKIVVKRWARGLR